MTTSRQPWSTRSEGNSCLILDASGNTIGQFNDWQDAELCVECVKNPTKLERLMTEKEDLETDVESLGQDLSTSEKRVEELEARLSKAMEALSPSK